MVSQTDFDVQLPKLDVAGSIPVSRFFFSITCLPSSRLRFSVNDVGKRMMSPKCTIFSEIRRFECQRDALKFSADEGFRLIR